MRKKNRIRLLICIFSFVCMSNNIFAKDQLETFYDGKKLIKTYSFQTEDQKETHDDMFPEMVEEKNKKYVLGQISYEVKEKKKNPVMIEEKVSEIVDSGVQKYGKDYHPDQTIEKDGITYSFDSIKTIEKEYRQPVTSFQDYEKQITRDSVPKEKKVTVKNNHTGKNQEVICSLSDVQKLNSSKKDISHIDITFKNYDADTFVWQGHKVKKNEKNPLKGYEQELLKSVGLNGHGWNVTSISWNGKPYQKGTVMYRNARAVIERNVQLYRATYTGNIKTGARYEVTYTGIKKMESDTEFHEEYVMLAKAEYSPKSQTAVYIAAGIGSILLFLLIVRILFILSRKQKRTKTEGGENE